MGSYADQLKRAARAAAFKFLRTLDTADAWPSAKAAALAELIGHMRQRAGLAANPGVALALMEFADALEQAAAAASEHDAPVVERGH